MATFPANGSNVDTWDAALLAWLTDTVFDSDGSFKSTTAPIFAGLSLTGGTLNVGEDLLAYGNSITVGTGASDSDHAFINLIGSAKNLTVDNDAMSGKELADFFDNIYLNYTASSGITAALLGYNDMRDFGENSTAVACFKRAVRSLIAWAGIPHSKKIVAQDTTKVSYTGTWTDLPLWDGDIARYSSDAGATATFSVYGKTVFVDIIQYYGYTCSFQIDIDGVDVGTFNGSDFVAPVSNRLFAPYLLRFDGLEDGEHEVVLTVVSGTGSAYFSWAAGSGGINEADGPYVFIGNCLRMTTAGYAAGGSDFDNGTDDAVKMFNAVMEEAVIELSNDGVNVALVDACAYYDLDNDVSGDDIHPNDSGHQHIANAFLAMMNSVAQVRGRGVMQPDYPAYATDGTYASPTSITIERGIITAIS